LALARPHATSSIAASILAQQEVSMPSNRSERVAKALILFAAVLLALFLVATADRQRQQNALKDALLTRNEAAIARLLDEGATPGPGRTLQSMADEAFGTNQPRIVVALMRRGVQPRYERAPATIVSAAEVCPDLVEWMLAHGANADERDSTGRSALMARASRERLGIVRLLLDRGADVNGRDKAGNTPLSSAVYARTPDIARLLLDRGADPNARDATGRTALMMAQSPDIARLLVERGADVNVRDANGATALSLAAKSGSLDIIRFLLSRGARLDPGPRNDAALTQAVRGEIFKAADRMGLIRTRGAVSYASVPGVQLGPLSEAVRGGKLEAARLLLRLGPARSDLDGALLLAVCGGRGDFARSLLAAGGRIDPKSPDGRLAVNAACEHANVDILELLRPFGVTMQPTPAQRELRNSMAQTPLLIALSSGNRAAAELLIKQGADVNVEDYRGRTPLIESVEFCPGLVPVLLAKGADPNILSNVGDSALKAAVLADNSDCVRQLLAHRAGPNARHPRGHTPLYYARKHHYTRVITLLEHAGAREE
jgi:ankyrin repeat protein